MKNYYHILQVSRQATFHEIKSSYRKLVQLYHPDKHAGNGMYAEKFIEIREAYEVLSDDFKRRWYDELYFAPRSPQMVYARPVQRQPFVRREVPMSKLDKQIFFGGIALFIAVAVILYYIFVPGIIEQEELKANPNAYTDWSIVDQFGNERRLTNYQFDSLLQRYNLQPGQVAELIDSLKNAEN